MKKSLLFSLGFLMVGLLAGSFANAQSVKQVNWSFSSKKIGEKTYEVHMTAIPDKGWHIYSQEQPSEAIAQPTAIKFTKNPIVLIEGLTKEVGEKEKYEDKTAGIIQYQYAKVDFVQSVKLKAEAKTTLTGTITYQACTDEMCLPPKTVSFGFKTKTTGASPLPEANGDAFRVGLLSRGSAILKRSS